MTAGIIRVRVLIEGGSYMRKYGMHKYIYEISPDLGENQKKKKKRNVHTFNALLYKLFAFIPNQFEFCCHFNSKFSIRIILALRLSRIKVPRYFFIVYFLEDMRQGFFQSFNYKAEGVFSKSSGKCIVVKQKRFKKIAQIRSHPLHLE